MPRREYGEVVSRAMKEVTRFDWKVRGLGSVCEVLVSK